MSTEKSILVVLERTGDPAPVLRRAVLLARQLGARLDMCLCEAETAYALQHQFDSAATDRVRQRSQQKSHAWIERVWQAVAAPDVPVNIEILFESPMFEAVRRRTQASRPELVVRGIGTAAECTFSVGDADLVRACPAPLLLTRGRPWRAHPTVVAALDVSGEEPPQLIQRVLLAADDIARRCGRVSRLFAEPRPARRRPAAGAARRLRRGGGRASGRHARARGAAGDAEFVRRRECEISGRAGTPARAGRFLTAHLLSADCDLLLVRPSLRRRSVTRQGRRGDDLWAAWRRHRACKLARLDDEDVALTDHMRSAVLPISSRFSPERATAPITTMSARMSSATCWITSTANRR
jgi:hypothetical protein